VAIQEISAQEILFEMYYLALAAQSQRAPGRKEQEKTSSFQWHFSRLGCFITGNSFSRKKTDTNF
jgi:hypothetical protein